MQKPMKSVLAFIFSAGLALAAQGQVIVDIDDDEFTATPPSMTNGVGGILLSSLTFGAAGGYVKSDEEIKSGRELTLKKAAEHAEAKGCAYIAQRQDTRTTERQRRLKWEEAERQEETGIKGNGSYEKSYMVRLANGRVFTIAHSVDHTIIGTTHFVCIRNEQQHKVLPTAIATPKEFM